MKADLHRVLQHPHIWRGGENPWQGRRNLESGYPSLDRLLPGGGWPCGSLTEILSPRYGMGELSLILPAMARLSRQDRWIIWIQPPFTPYPPALSRQGIALSRLVCIQCEQPDQQLWGLEQSLRSNACGAVIAWPPCLKNQQLRKLQLAAENGENTVCILFSRQPQQHSPVRLRLEVEKNAEGMQVRISKCRGGRPSGPITLPL